MPSLSDFLLRLQTDHDFYFQFLESPDQTLAAYDLSAEERTSLLESGPQLSAVLRQALNYFMQTNHYRPMAEGAEFNLAASLARPEVQAAIAEIRSAPDRDARMAAVSALIQYLR